MRERFVQLSKLQLTHFNASLLMLKPYFILMSVGTNETDFQCLKITIGTQSIWEIGEECVCDAEGLS